MASLPSWHVLAAVLVVVTLLPAPVAAAEAERPPNIVLILADDLGLADVSTYGHDRIPTPNIDRIGKEGVIFDRGYVTVPVCSPSRAALLTGRYQERYGFEYNARMDRRLPDIGLDPEEVTLARELKRAGYRTGLVGKWHLGYQDRFYPTNRGFDEFFGMLAGATGYIDRSLPEVESLDVTDFERETGAEPGSLPLPGMVGRRAGFTRIVRGPEAVPVDNYDRYVTEEFARESVAFIERHRGEPFFLYAAFNAPHSPFETTKKYYDRFPDVKSRVQRVYFAMVSALDDAVGEILAALERTGVADDTLVIFLSDNGCAAYQPLICACEPVRGGKLTYYEGGVRVPFFVRWPKRIEAGRRFPRPVSSLDIFPTALAAAGVAVPEGRVLDGVDLLAVLRGSTTDSVHQRLVWRSAPSVAIRQGNHKLIKANQDLPGGLLFDLEADPLEKSNLLEQLPEVAAQLETGLAEWRKTKKPAAWPARAPVAYDACGIEPVPFPP